MSNLKGLKIKFIKLPIYSKAVGLMNQAPTLN